MLTLFGRSQDAPEYLNGLWACIAASLVIICTVLVLDTYFWFSNKRQARGELVIEPVEGADVSEPFFVELRHLANCWSRNLSDIRCNI